MEKAEDTLNYTKYTIETLVSILDQTKALEPEQYSKSHKTGNGVRLFEHLLSIESKDSGEWRKMARKAVGILQYWLEMIRKANDNCQWWEFINIILQFMEKLHVKETSMSEIMTEMLSKSLFEIACSDSLTPRQRYAVLDCLNLIGAESSRQIRIALRNNFTNCFTKLAQHIASIGYFPAQICALETLMRWLVPRSDRALISAAADTWFPPHIYPQSVKDIFLNASWINYTTDGRKLLNALNKAKGLVTSVKCRKLYVGGNILIYGSEKNESWIDINTAENTITILVNARALHPFTSRKRCGALVLDPADTLAVTLLTESQGLIMRVKSDKPARAQPTDIAVRGSRDVTFVISSKVDLKELDSTLRRVFGDKYDALVDVDCELTSSPIRTQRPLFNPYLSEEDTRFSVAPLVNRKTNQHGLVESRSKTKEGVVSLSTTSKLAQLRDKLVPKSVIKKTEPIKERQDKTLKPSRVPEIISKRDPLKILQPSRDGNGSLGKKTTETRKTNKVIHGNLPRQTDDTIIDESAEHQSKTKLSDMDEDILDLLVQEANIAQDTRLESKRYQRKPSCEDKENKHVTTRRKPTIKNVRTVVSKPTTEDDSTTGVINDTPDFVNTRSKTRRGYIVEETISSNDHFKNRDSHESNVNHNLTVIREEASIIESAMEINKECQEPIQETNVLSKSRINIQPTFKFVNSTKGKRKLYSTKDDIEVQEPKKNTKSNQEVQLSNVHDEDSMTNLSRQVGDRQPTTPKANASAYQHIEYERQKNVQRLRQSICKSVDPMSMKNDAVFENQRSSINAAPDMTVYDFRPDSEDDDFDKKAFKLKEKVARGVNKNTRNTKPKKKRTPKKGKQKKNSNRVPVRDLQDEKIRQTRNTNILETSFEARNNDVQEHTDLVLKSPLQCEIIPDEEYSPPKKKVVKKVQNKKGPAKKVSGKDGNKSFSPLPELVVEDIPTSTRSTRPDDMDMEFMKKLLQQTCNKQGASAIAQKDPLFVSPHEIPIIDCDNIESVNDVINLSDNANVNKRTRHQKKAVTESVPDIDEQSVQSRQILNVKNITPKQFALKYDRGDRKRKYTTRNKPETDNTEVETIMEVTSEKKTVANALLVEVSLPRLSEEDIRQWIPSPRIPDSDDEDMPIENTIPQKSAGKPAVSKIRSKSVEKEVIKINQRHIEVVHNTETDNASTSKATTGSKGKNCVSTRNEQMPDNTAVNPSENNPKARPLRSPDIEPELFDDVINPQPSTSQETRLAEKRKSSQEHRETAIAVVTVNSEGPGAAESHAEEWFRRQSDSQHQNREADIISDMERHMKELLEDIQKTIVLNEERATALDAKAMQMIEAIKKYHITLYESKKTEISNLIRNSIVDQPRSAYQQLAARLQNLMNLLSRK